MKSSPDLSIEHSSAFKRSLSNSACIHGSKCSGPNNVWVHKAIFLAIWLSKPCSCLVGASAQFVAPGLYIIQKLNQDRISAQHACCAVSALVVIKYSRAL